MKVILLVVSFIFISALASAQSNFLDVQLPKAPMASFIGYSNIGKVYALPQDNMPCIVPPVATAALMPVAKTPLLHSGIPNAFPEQDLIAVNTTNYNFFKLSKAPLAVSKNFMLDPIRKK